MIKNIVFDMGNVLLRFDPDMFLDRVGISGQEDRILLKRVVYQSLEWARMDRGSLTDEEATAMMCRHLPERLHEAVNLLVAHWDRPIVEIPGAFTLVEELSSLGYKIYLLSNASYRQHDYWPRVPASRFFDGTLISADVKLVKPQPEIYRLFFENFGLKAEECFFIDDAINNIEGAFFVGMPGAVFHGDVKEIRYKLNEAGVSVSIK